MAATAVALLGVRHGASGRGSYASNAEGVVRFGFRTEAVQARHGVGPRGRGALIGATAARGGGGGVVPWAPEPVPGPGSDTFCSPTTCGGGGGSCTGGGYAGYFYPTLLTIGHSATANVDDIYHDLNSTGSVAAYVGVGNNYVWPDSRSTYIQAGLVDGGGGLTAFVQWDINGTAYPAIWTYASSDTNYTATVTRVSSNVWKASIDGLSHEITETMTHTDFSGEGNVSSPSNQCQVIDFQFSSMSPWNTSATYLSQSGPYFVTNVTSTGFEAAGGS